MEDSWDGSPSEADVQGDRCTDEFQTAKPLHSDMLLALIAPASKMSSTCFDMAQCLGNPAAIMPEDPNVLFGKLIGPYLAMIGASKGVSYSLVYGPVLSLISVQLGPLARVMAGCMLRSYCVNINLWSMSILESGEG